MKEFVTAAREDFHPEDDESVTFKHDEREVTFFRPTTAQIALIAAYSQATEFDMAGGYLATFFGLCDDESRRYFYARLMDRNDPFDIDSPGGVNDIMEGLLEEWSGRPTKRPSDYRRPQSATGARSTATTRARASTSSASRRAASST